MKIPTTALCDDGAYRRIHPINSKSELKWKKIKTRNWCDEIVDQYILRCCVYRYRERIVGYVIKERGEYFFIRNPKTKTVNVFST